MAALKLKGLIEDLCWKAGLNAKDVEEIVIYPTTLTVRTRPILVEGGIYRRESIEVPYVWEDEGGDEEEGGQAADRT